MTLLLALIACKKDEPVPPVSAAIDASSPLRAEVGSAVGVGSVIVPVWQVNAYGVAVPGDFSSVDLALSGADIGADSVTVTMDAMGRGRFEVTSPYPQEIVVTPVSSLDAASVGEPASSWILGGTMPELTMDQAWVTPADPEQLVALDSSFVYSIGSQIYWQDLVQGQPPMLVAELPSALLGMASADIDADGLQDLAAWTNTELILLRGYQHGGFTWGGGYEIPGSEIRGVSLGDVTNDSLADLTIAYSGDSAGGIQILEGDGVWGFEGHSPLDLDYVPWDVAVGQFGTDGQADLAILMQGDDGVGTVRRYGHSPDGWLPNGIDLGGTQLDPPLWSGARLLGAADLTGDGVDALVALGDPEAGEQVVAWWTFIDNPRQYSKTFDGSTASLGEVSGDGLTEILLGLYEQELGVITGAGADFTLRRVATVPTGGPVSGGHLDDDSLGDGLVGTDLISMYKGGDNPDVSWSLALDGFVTYGMKARGEAPLLVEDLDEDGWPEVIAIRQDPDTSEETSLRIWHLYYDEDSGQYGLNNPSSNTVYLDEQGGEVASGLDMAICDGSIYALVEDEGQWLYSVDLDVLTGELSERSVTEVTGQSLACGELADNVKVVVADSGGSWNSYKRNLTPVDSGTFGESAWDIGLADLDGEGDALQHCGEEDCSIEVADIDGDGLDEVLVGGSGARLLAWGEELELDQSGEASFGDIDGDGRLDLMLTDTSMDRLAVYRSLQDGLAWPLVLHVRRDLQGPARWMDADGDGSPELLFEAADGNLLRSGLSSEMGLDEEPDEPEE